MTNETHRTTTQAPRTTRPAKDTATPLYDTREAAAYIDHEPATLEQWRYQGKGPRFVKIGRSVRYRRADLDAFLEQRVFQSTAEAKAAA